MYTAEQSFLQEWNHYSTDLRNIGFGVTGTNLRYVTGFAPAACAATYATAAVPNGAPAENPAATNTLSNGTNVNTGATLATFMTAPVNINAKATVGSPANPCTATTFVGTAEGDPKNTPTGAATDVWTMNQGKLLRNTIVGL